MSATKGFLWQAAERTSGAARLEAAPSAPSEVPLSVAGKGVGMSALLEFMARRVSGTVWTTDAELRFTSSFGASLQELNLQPNEAVGKSLYEYFGTADDAFPAIAAHRRALAGEAVDFEMCWLGRHFQTRLEPLRDDAGTIIGCAGYARDVTEHEQLVEALRASERQAHQELEREVKRRTADLRRANEQLQHEVAERREAENRLTIFEQFAEAAGQVFAMAGLDTRITYVNAFGCQLAGRTLKDIVGASFLDYFGVEAREQLRTQILPRLLADGKWTGELTGWTAEGVGVAVMAHAFLVRDVQAGELRYAAVITDMTGPQAAREALRQSEEQYRTLVEACPDAVVMLDVEQRVTFASQRALELYGAGTPTELIGKRLEELVAAHERERLRTNLPGLLQDGTRRIVEYTLCRHDGTTFAGEVSAAVVRDMRGQPKVLIALIRDVTERKLAQEALEQERQNLWHMLRSSDHERQLIAYEIHDGLAQDLAGALLQLQTFEYQRERNPERAQAAFDAGLAALRQAHVETRRLISRVRPPILDEYGIDAALSHLVAEKSRTAEPRLEYECELEFKRLAPILENAIYRIAQEALANACKHSGSREVRMSLLQEGDSVCLEIRDWGVGFDPETVVGQRFGLKGIQERTRMLGGTLTIDSGSGQGTRIRVVLPLLKREEPGIEEA